MAKNLFFGSLDHPKMHLRDFWIILHDLVTLPEVGKHLVLPQYAISSRSNRPNPRKWPKTSILVLWIIQKCICVTFEWPFMTWWPCRRLENIQSYHIMQYQVDPTDQIPENGQRTLFWLFVSFKNAFLWSLNDPSWLGNVAKWSKTFSTITICNIKLIRSTNLKKMAENLILGHFWAHLHE